VTIGVVGIEFKRTVGVRTRLDDCRFAVVPPAEASV
jgi:hypothetical protein